MIPIPFPEQTVVFAKDQPQYLPLPAYSAAGQVITCWRLTWRERFKLLVTGKLWLRQLTFSAALQPQSPGVDYPFVKGTR